MTAQCPVCRGELVISAADVTAGGTRYGYWCPACQEWRDPARDNGPLAGRLPKSYLAATWRNVTPVDAEAKAIGIGFDLPSGTVRMALGLEGARHLAEALTGYLAGYRRAQSHSDKSAGIPSVEVSTPDEGVYV